MKKILLTMCIVLFCVSFVQSQTVKLKAKKPKYENIKYKNPGEKASVFFVDRIVYSTNYKGKEKENSYQISIYGKTNGKTKQVHYTAKSVDEFDYYRRIFKSSYKEILVFENNYKAGGKTYFDVAITVEY
ncbi:hypothetical protein [Hyunsoonleella pacifica]|uniref:Uncharacterized protein n=1 Tax=Hyunsoonleella pacifica TaxID=1080224 RepID=A0A4Q9FKH8_9FLAO|nr:hypothetical protein [Hyunsoonleella pacifica]TBN13115.1 hypothetical protein EYD46_16595 [Hyunsoonleella pacifica]